MGLTEVAPKLSAGDEANMGGGGGIGDTSKAVSEPQTGPVARYTGTSLLALKGDPTTVARLCTPPLLLLLHYLVFCPCNNLLFLPAIKTKKSVVDGAHQFCHE